MKAVLTIMLALHNITSSIVRLSLALSSCATEALDLLWDSSGTGVEAARDRLTDGTVKGVSEALF